MEVFKVVVDDGCIHLKVHIFLMFHLGSYLEGRGIFLLVHLCLLVLVFVG